MRPLLKSSFLSLALLLSLMAFAGEGDVAKVIILKGNVKAKLKGGKIITLKKGDWIPEGVQVKTEAKSFVKLLFIDKSQMNLGPNSQMIINKFPKKKAGIITLMKGQLRSKVTKDYMQMDKSREKLYIKTKTAAMGVRGTDFEVSINEQGHTATNLYEGRLVVTTISPEMSPEAVRAVFSNPAALTPITAGQMAIFKGEKSPPAVIKIPPSIMKEAVKSGGKGGDLKTLLDKSVQVSGANNLLLPGTNKEDVANTSAGEESAIVVDKTGPAITEDAPPTIATEDPNAPPTEDGRAPANVRDPNAPPANEGEIANGYIDPPAPVESCPLSGCAAQGMGQNDPLDPVVYGGGVLKQPTVLIEDPCVMDPALCEVVPNAADICATNPQLAQCGGGATSTNVQFNFSTQ